MKAFYVVLGNGGGLRGFLLRFLLRKQYESLQDAKDEAKKRCKANEELVVLQAVGFVHIPEPRVTWRKTKAAQGQASLHSVRRAGDGRR